MQWLNHRALETEVTVLFSRASETHRPLLQHYLAKRRKQKYQNYFAELRFTDYRDFLHFIWHNKHIICNFVFVRQIGHSRRPLHSHKSRQRNNAITPQWRKNHALQIDIYFCRNDKFAGENIIAILIKIIHIFGPWFVIIHHIIKLWGGLLNLLVCRF